MCFLGGAMVNWPRLSSYSAPDAPGMDPARTNAREFARELRRIALLAQRAL